MFKFLNLSKSSEKMPISIDELTNENPLTEERAEMRRTRYHSLVEQGLHKESKIDLYTLAYKSVPQSNIFIYPTDLKTPV